MVLSMDKWHGKIAVVTGASSGIGAAIAESLVNAGVVVVGLARRKEKMDNMAEKLNKGDLKRFHAVKTDVSSEEEILEAFKWTVENLGVPHILINNAGVLFNETLMEGTTACWKKVLDTNVIGLSVATREAIKLMREKTIDGHIVHINSIVGHGALPIPNLNMYIGSKHAVTALTEVLRQELVKAQSKIKITSISPGVVDTEIWDVSGLNKDETTANVVQTYPMLKSEDIADAVIYALSTPPHVQVHEVTVKPIGEPF